MLHSPFLTHIPPTMQLCFLLVLAGISMVVSTMYIYIVPYLYATQHPILFALYVLYGHYLLVMICFNYFSGVYTNPGAAPRVGVRAAGAILGFFLGGF